MNACIDWAMIHGARAEHERDAGAAGCWRWYQHGASGVRD